MGKPRKLGSSAGAVRQPYLRAVGISEVAGTGSRVTLPEFTAEEEGKFKQMACNPEFSSQMRRSIAPSIFGHDDVKWAVCCQVLDGSHFLENSYKTET